MSKLGGFFAPLHLILQDIPSDMIQDGFEIAHYGQVLSAQSHLMSLTSGQQRGLLFPKQDIFINGMSYFGQSKPKKNQTPLCALKNQLISRGQSHYLPLSGARTLFNSKPCHKYDC